MQAETGKTGSAGAPGRAPGGLCLPMNAMRLALADLAQPGAVVLEAGAGMGFDAAFLAQSVGTEGFVEAFEANPLLIPFAARNMEAWGVANCSFHHNLLWSESGLRRDFPIPARYFARLRPGGSVRLRTRGVSSTVAPTLTVDDFCASRGRSPGMLNATAWGTSAQVLLGSMETVARCRPGILFRPDSPAGSASDPEAAIRHLLQCGYRIFHSETYERCEHPAIQAEGGGSVLISVPEQTAAGGQGLWSRDPELHPHMTLPADFRQAEAGGDWAGDYFFLPPGRWILTMRMRCSGVGRILAELTDHVGRIVVNTRADARRFAGGISLPVQVNAGSGHRLLLRPLNPKIRISIESIDIIRVVF